MTDSDRELINRSQQARGLEDVLYVELQKMLARNLDFAPAAEDLPATYAVFLEDLKRWGLTDDDTDRLRWAFWYLGPRVDRFPKPWTLIQALPAKRERKQAGVGFVNREGQKQFVDIARAVLDGKTAVTPDEEGE